MWTLLTEAPRGCWHLSWPAGTLEGDVVLATFPPPGLEDASHTSTDSLIRKMTQAALNQLTITLTSYAYHLITVYTVWEHKQDKCPVFSSQGRTSCYNSIFFTSSDDLILHIHFCFLMSLALSQLHVPTVKNFSQF